MDWFCGTQDCFMAAGGFEGYVSKKEKEGEGQGEREKKAASLSPKLKQ
jgi:hypothetical protein